MSSRRQRCIDRVFMAGDRDDVPAIEQLLATLSPETYGQVFIEILDEADVLPLAAPERVAVTWLTRTARPGSALPRRVSEQGEVLATAIDGWVSEWMPDEPDTDGPFLMWVGCAAGVASLRNVPGAVIVVGERPEFVRGLHPHDL